MILQKISYNDLKNSVLNNFYDIYYPQPTYFRIESKIKEYERDNINYVKFISSKIPKEKRQASIILKENLFNQLETKWYHFVFFESFYKYISICHKTIIDEFFQIKINGHYVMIVDDSMKMIDRNLLHYIFSKFIIGLDQFGFVIVGKKKDSSYSLEYNSHICDYHFFDKIIHQVIDVKNNFSTYEIQGLQPRLYPQFFHKQQVSRKKYLCGLHCGEISQLFQIGEKFRMNCHSKGIFSFFDERFEEELDTHRYKEIIKRIISANQDINQDINKETSMIDTSWKIIDESILENPDYQRLLQSYQQKKIICFDFEFTSSHIYLSGFYNLGNKQFTYIWESKSIISFLQQLVDYLNLHRDYIFVYYCIEKKKIKEMATKHHFDFPKELFENWIDLNCLVRDYTAFRYSLDFKLKNIEYAFQQQNLISTPYSSIHDCQCGTDSILLFEEYQLDNDDKKKQNLISYNELDCKNLAILCKEIMI